MYAYINIYINKYPCGENNSCTIVFVVLLLLVLKIQCYHYMLRLVHIQCITFTKKANLYYLAIVFVARLTYAHLFLAIHFVFAQLLLLLVQKIQCYHYLLRLVYIQLNDCIQNTTAICYLRHNSV